MSVTHLAWILSSVLVLLPAPARPAGGSAFLVNPDPPSAGQDVSVTFGGQGSEVLYQIGDGELRVGKLDKNKSFKIPKKLLKSGQPLYLIEVFGDGSRDVCVFIEPSS